MIAGCVIVLVAIEPDLGTTGVITLTAFTMFFVAGASLWQLAVMLPAGHGGPSGRTSTRRLPAGPLEHLRRPLAGRPPSKAYQTIQGLLALALGGLFGQGLGRAGSPGACRCRMPTTTSCSPWSARSWAWWVPRLVIGLFMFLA